MTSTLVESPVVADRAHALRLAKRDIKTLVQTRLGPIVTTMLSEEDCDQLGDAYVEARAPEPLDE